MKQQLRVVIEVAGVAVVAPFAGTILAAILSLPLCSLSGPAAVRVVGSLIPATGAFLVVACPCIGGFVYGRTRPLHLRFAAVFAAWVVGWLLYGLISRGTLSMISTADKHTKPGHAHWWGWLLWFGWLVVSALLPTLATMWGQRRRLAAAGPATEVTAN